MISVMKWPQKVYIAVLTCLLTMSGGLINEVIKYTLAMFGTLVTIMRWLY